MFWFCIQCSLGLLHSPQFKNNIENSRLTSPSHTPGLSVFLCLCVAQYIWIYRTVYVSVLHIIYVFVFIAITHNIWRMTVTFALYDTWYFSLRSRILWSLDCAYRYNLKYNSLSVFICFVIWQRVMTIKCNIMLIIYRMLTVYCI